MTRIAAICAVLLLTACASAPRQDLGLEKIRADLQALQDNEQIRRHAGAELQAAEAAVRRLQAPVQGSNKDDQRQHLAFLAQRRIDIVRARANEGQEREQLAQLERERDRILLQASLQEAERARAEAERLRLENVARAEEAERALRDAREAREYSEQVEKEADLAREEAEKARRLAQTQAREADLARQEAELASATADSLRRQLENLQAQETSRGLMFTLGDVLFEYGESRLKQESLQNLDRLVGFLEQYPDNTISIEGHTDSRGSEQFNLDLSQARADSVRRELINRGLPAARLQAVGLGEEFPVASNDNDPGRQQNRRVEIIILNDSQQ
ncbi:MAG: OmpA family protein [Xanthomonadales bacterium]|nr:OmpA family protein [Xanthomonadales bacterium]